MVVGICLKVYRGLSDRCGIPQLAKKLNQVRAKTDGERMETLSYFHINGSKLC